MSRPLRQLRQRQRATGKGEGPRSPSTVTTRLPRKRSLEQELALIGMVVVLWRARARYLRNRHLADFEEAMRKQQLTTMKDDLPRRLQDELAAADADQGVEREGKVPRLYDFAMLWTLTNAAVELPLASTRERRRWRRLIAGDGTSWRRTRTSNWRGASLLYRG